MPLLAHWTYLEFGAGKHLVYSPRWGRSYVLTAHQRNDAALLNLLGLDARGRQDPLVDPATSVAHSNATLATQPDAPAWTPGTEAALYRFLHRSRSIVPLGVMIGWVSRRATRGSVTAVQDIGARVARVERSAGVSDCYPRALFTARCCVQARLPCQLVIGALAPTRMLHAWCCVDGRVPYEPSPEHWIYQPALVLDVTP